MTEHEVVTAKESYLIDAHISPPSAGSRILALQRGGCLVSAVWGSDSLEYYDAWCCYPTVPKSVKDRQMARYLKGGQ